MPEITTMVWEVTLPDRQPSLDSYNRKKPQAVLTITTDARGTEHLHIPVSVGKLLNTKREAEEVNPASRAELLYLVREISLRHAAARIERLVNKREYATVELDQKLTLDGFAPSVRQEALMRAQECGLVSDARYGASYVRTKLSSGWGISRIERELKSRGIALEDLPGWPEDFVDEDSEDDRAYRIACTRRFSDKNGYEKLVRYLCGRGFALGCAMRVARRVADEAAGAL